MPTLSVYDIYRRTMKCDGTEWVASKMSKKEWHATKDQCSVRRFFDGSEIQWLIVKEGVKNEYPREFVVSSHVSQEIALGEADRINSPE